MSQHIPFDEILLTASDPISRLLQKDMFPVEQDPKFVPEWWVVNLEGLAMMRKNRYRESQSPAIILQKLWPQLLEVAVNSHPRPAKTTRTMVNLIFYR